MQKCSYADIRIDVLADFVDDLKKFSKVINLLKFFSLDFRLFT